MAYYQDSNKIHRIVSRLGLASFFSVVLLVLLIGLAIFMLTVGSSYFTITGNVTVFSTSISDKYIVATITIIIAAILSIPIIALIFFYSRNDRKH